MGGAGDKLRVCHFVSALSKTRGFYEAHATSVHHHPPVYHHHHHHDRYHHPTAASRFWRVALTPLLVWFGRQQSPGSRDVGQRTARAEGGGAQAARAGQATQHALRGAPARRLLPAGKGRLRPCARGCPAGHVATASVDRMQRTGPERTTDRLMPAIYVCQETNQCGRSVSGDQSVWTKCVRRPVIVDEMCQETSRCGRNVSGDQLVWTKCVRRPVSVDEVCQETSQCGRSVSGDQSVWTRERVIKEQGRRCTLC